MYINSTCSLYRPFPSYNNVYFIEGVYNPCCRSTLLLKITQVLVTSEIYIPSTYLNLTLLYMKMVIYLLWIIIINTLKIYCCSVIKNNITIVIYLTVNVYILIFTCIDYKCFIAVYVHYISKTIMLYDVILNKINIRVQ